MLAPRPHAIYRKWPYLIFVTFPLFPITASCHDDCYKQSLGIPGSWTWICKPHVHVQDHTEDSYITDPDVGSHTSKAEQRERIRKEKYEQQLRWAAEQKRLNREAAEEINRTRQAYREKERRREEQKRIEEQRRAHWGREQQERQTKEVEQRNALDQIYRERQDDSYYEPSAALSNSRAELEMMFRNMGK